MDRIPTYGELVAKYLEEPDAFPETGYIQCRVSDEATEPIAMPVQSFMKLVQLGEMQWNAMWLEPNVDRASFSEHQISYHLDKQKQLIEDMLLMKFPDLKNLHVGDNSIKFDDDGIHTAEMIETFLNQFNDDTNNALPIN